ncbi:NADP oxidoreductase [Rhodococcus sp. 06-156-3C]|uniref:NADPH-dependent F420 reductase n=1 Tax=Nocardiaceae TaxID=85025 RepID=UPI000522FC1C|nr:MULTISPECIES: NAD(P)-binding domain-containing protein [Rhodococcus]OZD18238.1 NADP oxidoreductase [Rhodococcus sp. 06-156-4C]OZD18836.1 NADP oxidoreductase [Rhodococcus sp. 06-156-3C]OZD22346.1 NADP oxidoreductase [Rhodococcus sp. 06-156-4a]OZD33930.1 NADP oxidoreductase [Rhodococcus sp. 06-156-3b]OZD38667.1 NADP oxidoreductase [Rhodococcus sp. 06-156-3]
MKIGIIGAGFIGGTLTRRLTQLGHEVRVSNSRDPQTLAELAAETGARAVWAKDAAEDADLVVVSIPQKNTPDLPKGTLSARKPGAPVIETNNYYPQQRDGKIAAIEDGQPESAWVSELLGVPVYKVFNGIHWKHLLERGTEAGTEGRIALPIAGDDEDGKKIVSAIVDELGFDPVDAGTIAESWRQQPGTPSYGKDFTAPKLTVALAVATPERTAEWKA